MTRTVPLGTYHQGPWTYEQWAAYYGEALEPQLTADVTYEEYRENARQQLERDRGAFTGETPRREIDPRTAYITMCDCSDCRSVGGTQAWIEASV